MDINDLGKLKQDEQPFSVRIVRDANWRDAAEVSVTIFLPVTCLNGRQSEVAFDFKHPALYSLPTTLSLFQSLQISYVVDDRLAGSGSTSPEHASPVNRPQRPCLICGKSSFKTSRNCYNPSNYGNKPWACLLQLDNFREPSDRLELIHRNGG